MKTFASAFVKAQAHIRHALKEGYNPFYKSKYADLASVFDACKEALNTNGFAILQPTRMDLDRIVLRTILLHESGESMEGEVSITPMREKKDAGWIESKDPQSIGSAITYARRYALAAMVGVATEDDDAEAASGRGEAKEAAKVDKAPPPAKKEAPKDSEPAPFVSLLDDDTKRKKLGDFASSYQRQYNCDLSVPIKIWSTFHSKDRSTGEPLYNNDGSPKFMFKTAVGELAGKWLHVAYENGKRWYESEMKKSVLPQEEQEIPSDLFTE